MQRIKESCCHAGKFQCMKGIMLFAISGFLTFLTAGCKKENGDDNSEMNTSLVGIWELRYSSGGMMAPTSYPAGNGPRIRFEETKFQYSKGGQVIFEGTYQLATDSIIDVRTCAKLPPATSAPNRLIYNNNPSGSREFFELSGNTLKIMTGCIPLDGGTSTYKRVGNISQ